MTAQETRIRLAKPLEPVRTDEAILGIEQWEQIYDLIANFTEQNPDQADELLTLQMDVRDVLEIFAE